MTEKVRVSHKNRAPLLLCLRLVNLAFNYYYTLYYILLPLYLFKTVILSLFLFRVIKHDNIVYFTDFVKK